MMRAALGLVVMLVLAAWTDSARAGTYDVYACRLPDGSPAPTHGWTGFALDFAPGAEPGSGPSDQCSAGGSMVASIPVSADVLDPSAGWRFDAPVDTKITAAEVRRWVLVSSTAPAAIAGYAVFQDFPTPGTPGFEGCTSGYVRDGVAICSQVGTPDAPNDPANRYEVIGLPASRFWLAVTCALPTLGACSADPADPGPRLTIHDARVTLSDTSSPIFGAGPTLHPDNGTVTVDVSDRGSGVSRLDLLVDGDVVGGEEERVASASCRPPYVDPVPCPLTRQASLALDESKLGAGVHQVAVRAFDAAGNATTTAAGTLETAAPPGVTDHPSSGGQAYEPAASVQPVQLKAWFEGRRQPTQLVARYGQTVQIQGTATLDGRPVVGVTLTASERRSGTTARAVVTNAQGRFSYVTKAKESRAIAFVHGSGASTTVLLRVKPVVTLRTSPAHVHNGTTMAFSGHVGAAPGTRRALVTIYSVQGGARKRIPVETVRADSAGRFSYRYTFRYLAVPRRTGSWPWCPSRTGSRTSRGSQPSRWCGDGRDRRSGGRRGRRYPGMDAP